MTGQWQLQEAKNKFSEVIDEAVRSGPQVITRHGVQVAVILSFEQYSGMKRSREKLSSFFRRSHLSEVVLERDVTPVRETDNL